MYMETKSRTKKSRIMEVIATFQFHTQTECMAMTPRDLISIVMHNHLSLSFTGIVSGCRSYRITVPLRGGKGGFGKLLKSQKNIGKKTDNFDSCRDLQGRRLRATNKEEKLRQFKELKQAEDDIVKSLQSSSANAKPTVTLDEKYTKQLEKVEKQKVSAVLDGLRVATSSSELKAPSAVPKTKKLRLFDDESISD